MKDVRLHWLAHLLEERFKGVRADFFKATGLTKGRLSQMENEGFGDLAATRLLERLAKKGMKLPPDYFDRPIPKAASEPSNVTQIQQKEISELEAFERFAAAVNKLKPDKRRRVIDSFGLYAADLSDQDERDYVVRALSGERATQKPRKRSSGGK